MESTQLIGYLNRAEAALVWRGCRAEQLTSQHQRLDFSCGVEELDRYLTQQATQDLRRMRVWWKHGIEHLHDPA